MTIRNVKGLIGAFMADVLCLYETKLGIERMGKSKKSLAYPNMAIVSVLRRFGGLAILFKDGNSGCCRRTNTSFIVSFYIILLILPNI